MELLRNIVDKGAKVVKQFVARKMGSLLFSAPQPLVSNWNRWQFSMALQSIQRVKSHRVICRQNKTAWANHTTTEEFLRLSGIPYTPFDRNEKYIVTCDDFTDHAHPYVIQHATTRNIIQSIIWCCTDHVQVMDTHVNHRSRQTIRSCMTIGWVKWDTVWQEFPSHKNSKVSNELPKHGEGFIRIHNL